VSDENTPKRKEKRVAGSAESTLEDLAVQLRLQQEAFRLRLPTQTAVADAMRAIEQSSLRWHELAKAIDWGAQTRLYSEAVEAMKLSSAVEIQKAALQLGTTRIPKLLKEIGGATRVLTAPTPLESELRQLRDDVSRQSEALFAEKADRVAKEQQIADLNRTLETLRQRERLAFLLNQLHPAARPLLESSEDFRKQFLESGECTGFVVSVDIRRSTDLMLKARKSEQFAEFVSTLCQQLASAVLNNYGVFDKFTGDGIVAFFPEFYSGPDAGYWTVITAEQCHAAFATHYKAHRSVFNSVLKEAGLGIGVDYGNFSLVQVSGALTAVGAPVVYACRMSGAPAGSTLINQPAYEVINSKYGLYCAFEESDVVLKHEGPTLAYKLRRTGESFEPAAPSWKQAAPSARTGTT
jgi:class 3 adenylate cyclase